MSDFVTSLVTRPAVGAVVEASDGLVRVHYGTHATVDHGPLPHGDFDALVRREQERFAERREPVAWRVPGDAAAALPAALLRAGFTAGWSRALLVAVAVDLPRVGAMTATGGVTRSGWVRPLVDSDGEWVLDAATSTGPHRRPFAEAWADGPVAGFVAEADRRPVAAMWGHPIEGTGLAAIDGFTAVRTDLLAAWREWCLLYRVDHTLAEADGSRLTALVEAGLRRLGTYTSYHWSPAGPVESTRPVQPVRQPEYDAIWASFAKRFAFTPDIRSSPAIAEPPASVTWRLDPNDATGAVEAVVRQGLASCTAAGEELYFLGWQHDAYRLDPHRVGGPGQPPWAGAAVPDRNYAIYLSPDVRMGTFGHPLEASICVFGTELVAAVKADLSAMLGPPMRLAGRAA